MQRGKEETMSAILKSFPYKIFEAIIEKAKDTFYVLLSDVTLEKLEEPGLVKDSSITGALAKIFPNIPFLILSPLKQEGVKEEEYIVLIGPLTKKQLIEMGYLKVSSIK